MNNVTQFYFMHRKTWSNFILNKNLKVGGDLFLNLIHNNEYISNYMNLYTLHNRHASTYRKRNHNFAKGNRKRQISLHP